MGLLEVVATLCVVTDGRDAFGTNHPGLECWLWLFREMGIRFGLKRFPLRVCCFEPCLEAGSCFGGCGSYERRIGLLADANPRTAHPMASVCVELKPDSDGEARRDGRWLLKREDRRVVLAKLRVNRPAADWIAVKCGIYRESGLLKVCFGTLDF